MITNNKNVAKKIINIILDILIVILGIILLITIYNNIQIKILGNDYASFFGHSIFEVQTGSMEPEISAGDWIVVKYDNNIELNDIVTFQYKGEFITHRVIESYNGTYVTKGDANNAKDTPISKDQIIGKVTKILPNFGIFRKTIFNPIVLLLLIGTCYLAMQTFKKPSEKEIAKEQELIDSIKEKILSKKYKTKKVVVEEQKEEPRVEQKEEEVEVIETLEEEKPTQEEIDKAKELLEETPNIENAEDMDKTVFYRMVSVSEEEISSAYNTPVMIEDDVTEVVQKQEEVLDVTEDEVKLTLELIQKKKKKCKNFIEKSVLIKKEELEEIMMLLNLEEKLKTNEPTIRDKFIDSYVDAKYYNNCGEINLEYNNKNMNLRINECMNDIAEIMIKKYKGSDKAYQEKVEKYLKYILLINFLEQDYQKEEELDNKKKQYKARIDKFLKLELPTKEINQIISKILKVQKKYNGMIKFLLNKLETGMFELKYNSLSEKNTYAVELQHNIQFSKVYSDYIVDKTYYEGIVAEDKIEVLGSLLVAQITKDMFSGKFGKKYFIYVPETLYEKEAKLNKIFKMFDDDFTRNCVNIVVQFSELNKNKKVIKSLIKQGYHFSVDVNQVEKMTKVEEANLYLMDFIFMTKNKATKSNIIELIPTEVKSKITYDDITSKIGTF